MIVVLIFGHVLNDCDSYSMNSKWYNFPQFENFMNVTIHLKIIFGQRHMCVTIQCILEAMPL